MGQRRVSRRSSHGEHGARSHGSMTGMGAGVGSRRSWKGGGRSERSGRSGRRARACTGAL